MESSGLQRVTYLVELRPRGLVFGSDTDQSVNRVHAEPDRFHVKCGDGAAERVGFLEYLIARQPGGPGFQQRQQRIELLERRGGPFRHRQSLLRTQEPRNPGTQEPRTQEPPKILAQSSAPYQVGRRIVRPTPVATSSAAMARRDVTDSPSIHVAASAVTIGTVSW